MNKLIDEQVRAERRAGIDATILWLQHTHSKRAVRQRFAAELMQRSVWRQAMWQGLVSCISCGDQLCNVCRRELPDMLITDRDLTHLAPSWAPDPEFINGVRVE